MYLAAHVPLAMGAVGGGLPPEGAPYVNARLKLVPLYGHIWNNCRTLAVGHFVSAERAEGRRERRGSAPSTRR